MMSVLKTLFTPYILVNSFASVTYPLSKYSEVLCHLLYSTQEDCSLDWVCIDGTHFLNNYFANSYQYCCIGYVNSKL